ncbi:MULTISPECIES: hypothetical protein [Amycolatopsis]|uniref:hypothetical protein n=1 Tax=Amycolatopsis sp. cg13 TaxID=3238807 RepID=UPI0035236031
MGFTTVPEALRAADRAGRAAVGEIRGADCGTPVHEVSAALPGAKASSAAATFVEFWTATLASWCRDADEHAAALGTAADT